MLEVLTDVVDDPFEYDLVLWLVHLRKNIHELVKYLKRRPNLDCLVRELLVNDTNFYEVLKFNVFLQREVQSVLVKGLRKLDF